MRPFAVWESNVSGCCRTQIRRRPNLAWSLPGRSLPYKSVPNGGRVEPLIASRRNDVFQFLNRVTCGHCSNSSLSISFLFGLQSLVLFDYSSSGRRVASSPPPSRIEQRVFCLREKAKVNSKFLPLNMERSHGSEMVRMCRNVGQQKNLGEGSSLIKARPSIGARSL